MSDITDVVVIGAGPYGLSIAAHLRARGVDFRIFGSAMQTWRTQMPKGMYLKSEGFASNLYDPDSSFTLERFCREERIPYGDVGVPVALETFTAYGLSFRRRFVPSLEERDVLDVRRTPAGFEVDISGGETVRAKRVVVAAGITHFHYTPPALAGLPPEFVTHSSQHHELDRFAGRSVAVIGAGASAADVAGLLAKAGAAVQLVARGRGLTFQDPPEAEPRPLYQRVRRPRSGLGTGWKSRLYSDAPGLFRLLPQKLRHDIVRTHLGPAPCWFMRGDIEGKVPAVLGVQLERAEVRDGRVVLHLTGEGGRTRTLEVDHVIAATGYRVDLDRLTFLSDSVRASLRAVEKTPVLSRDFESSVPGLYFVGAAAANSFGPLLRFAFGAKHAARRMSSVLARAGGRAAPRRSTAGADGFEEGAALSGSPG